MVVVTVMSFVISVVIVDLTSDFAAGEFTAMHVDICVTGTKGAEKLSEFASVESLVPRR